MTENENVQQNCVDRQKVDMYLMSNQKYFPADKMFFLREKLYNITDQQFNLLSAVELKDPTTFLIISIFLGSFGVDRFMLGETGMGVLKLLTVIPPIFSSKGTFSKHVHSGQMALILYEQPLGTYMGMLRFFKRTRNALV